MKTIAVALCAFGISISGAYAHHAKHPREARQSVYAASHKASQVGTGKIKQNAVTAGKIKANAVTQSKIRENAVTNAKIRQGSVNLEKIAALGATKIRTGLGSRNRVPASKAA